MSVETNALSVRDLTVTYSDKPVLRDIDLDLPAGQLCAVIGPNGAGKSTLLKSVLGLIDVVSGTVLVGGKAFPEAQRLLGYVPQRSQVDWDFPADVMDVVLMGTYGRLGWFRRPGAKERAVAEEALVKVGMVDFARTHISELSGGQQQRVFVARALAQDAEVTLMDEPFAGVDVATEEAIAGVLRELVKGGKTVIVVHHDLETVRDLFDHVTVLKGEVVASGLTKDVMTAEVLQEAYGSRMPWRVSPGRGDV